MRPYVIKKGDHLSWVAFRMGFDAGEVWSHERNRALREKRSDPEILAPGDVLYVPEPRASRLPITSGGLNRFRASVPDITLRLAFRDGDRNEALANEPCLVEGLGPQPLERVTGADGVLTLRVPLHVRTFEVRFAQLDLVFPVSVGHLDPIDEASGVRQRLAHLGYAPRLPGEDMDDEAALRAFQKAQDLPITGRADDATRQKLLELHGS